MCRSLFGMSGWIVDAGAVIITHFGLLVGWCSWLMRHFSSACLCEHELPIREIGVVILRWVIMNPTVWVCGESFEPSCTVGSLLLPMLMRRTQTLILVVASLSSCIGRNTFGDSTRLLTDRVLVVLSTFRWSSQDYDRREAIMFGPLPPVFGIRIRSQVIGTTLPLLPNFRTEVWLLWVLICFGIAFTWSFLFGISKVSQPWIVENNRKRRIRNACQDSWRQFWWVHFLARVLNSVRLHVFVIIGFTATVEIGLSVIFLMNKPEEQRVKTADCEQPRVAVAKSFTDVWHHHSLGILASYLFGSFDSVLDCCC